MDIASQSDCAKSDERACFFDPNMMAQRHPDLMMIYNPNYMRDIFGQCEANYYSESEDEDRLYCQSYCNPRMTAVSNAEAMALYNPRYMWKFNREYMVSQAGS